VGFCEHLKKQMKHLFCRKISVYHLTLFSNFSHEMFIRELFERGIPPGAFYFYCRGLIYLHGKTVSNETMLLALDLCSAILSNMFRLGFRP
jgi:hypothetical protein